MSCRMANGSRTAKRPRRDPRALDVRPAVANSERTCRHLRPSGAFKPALCALSYTGNPDGRYMPHHSMDWQNDESPPPRRTTG